jgi:transcriptional regulator, iclR family
MCVPYRGILEDNFAVYPISSRIGLYFSFAFSIINPNHTAHPRKNRRKKKEAVCLSASNVQVLDRGLDLIERLATAENGMTISELVAETGLPKSTIHRILATFADRHYVEKNEETSVYSLGYKFVELASLYLNKIVLKTEAEPVMHTLAQVLHATTYLGVLENNEVMYLQRTEPRNSLRLYTSIGKREPLYCTALGKVLLASLPLKEFEHVAQHLSYEPYTPNSITNYEDLARDVMLVRKRGYATDRGEHTVDSSCLAVPIYDYTRKVMAALSVSGHGLLERCDEAYVYEKMRAAALDISHHMGYTEAALPTGRTHL